MRKVVFKTAVLGIIVIFAVSADTAVAATRAEESVREAFADTPVMIEIARCESGFRQFTDSGNVLRGGLGGGMIGIFQFSGAVHTQTARALSFDIETLEGNIGYAKHVYEESGTDPWISSFNCWGRNGQFQTDEADTVLSKDLHFGQSHPQVRVLQQLLNKTDHPVAASGPGAPGNETELFGNLTRTAVREFQCAENIACGGDEYTTGYGLVGAETRAALLAFEDDAWVAADRGTDRLQTLDRRELEARIMELLEILAELQRQLALREA